MSLSIDLHARICEAFAQTNTIDLTLWNTHPSSGEDVVMTERGIAPASIIHLYQLYLELSSELGECDSYDEVIQTPYQSAMCIVCELIALQIADMLGNSIDSSWVILQDGRIFEYQDDETEPEPLKPKVRPSYLTVVSSL